MRDKADPPEHTARPSGLRHAGVEDSGTTLAARLSPAGPEPNTPVHHGNAFSMMRARGETSRLPRKRDENTPPATLGEASKPGMVRRATGLNYDEELAIPMPKPPSRREPLVDETVPAEAKTPQTRARLLKKRSMPEPGHGKITPSPVNPADGKKKSRLEVIKSKLSFRDLRKEAIKEDERSESPRPPLPTRLMVYSPTLVTLKPLREMEGTSSPLGQEEQSPASSRIRLASSGTYTHAQGSMTAAKSTAGQERVESVGQAKVAAKRAETHGNLKPAIPVPAAKHKTGSLPTHVDSAGQTPAAAERVHPQGKPDTATKATPVPASKHRPSALVTRPSFEASTRRRSPLVPESAESDYAPTGDSPPKLSDLTEGSGKVKYLPKHWLQKSSLSTPSPTARSIRHGSTLPRGLAPTMESPSDPSVPSTPSPSSTIQSMHEGSSLSRERAPTMESPSSPMSGFEERLADTTLPLGNPAVLEDEGPTLADYKQELINKILGVQRQADAEIRDLTQKVVELSKWMHGQLANHAERIGDLEGTIKGLCSQQADLQRDLTKLKQDFDIKVNVANQRVDNLERKVQNDLEAEMQNLAISVQELTQKIEHVIENSAAHLREAPLIRDKQQEKLDELAREIAEIHQKHADQYNTLSTGSGRTQRFVSEPPFVTAKPSFDQPDAPLPPMRVSPMPRSVTVTPTPRREPASAENKTSADFRRSASIRKGLAKVALIPPGSQGKRANSGDDSKGWKLFGFRQRRDAHSDGSTTAASKFSWRLRPSKDGQATDNASSRSESPPPPPVPRHIQMNIENNIRAASQVHPAHRNLIQQTVMQAESLCSPTSQYHSAAMPAHVTQLPRPDSQVIGGITVSVAPSSASSRECRGAGGDMLPASCYGNPADPFNHSPTTPGSNPSFGHMRNPFSEEEDSHDWNRCSESLHEAKSDASLREARK